MVKTSSFRPLAEEIAPELDKILHEHFDSWGIIGHSFGARLAATVPETLESPESIDYLVMSDPPSRQKGLGMVGIAAAQFAEDIHISNYIKYSVDTEAQIARQTTDTKRINPYVPLSAQLGDIIVMSRDGFMEDLERSLGRLKPRTSVVLVAPELSHMNDNNPQNVRNFVTELHGKFPYLDFRGESVIDSTHSVSVANPAYFGHMVELGRPIDKN